MEHYTMNRYTTNAAYAREDQLSSEREKVVLRAHRYAKCCVLGSTSHTTHFSHICYALDLIWYTSSRTVSIVHCFCCWLVMLLLDVVVDDSAQFIITAVQSAESVF